MQVVGIGRKERDGKGLEAVSIEQRLAGDRRVGIVGVDAQGVVVASHRILEAAPILQQVALEVVGFLFSGAICADIGDFPGGVAMATTSTSSRARISSNVCTGTPNSLRMSSKRAGS
mgnify:CR=1 FL=1